jgi:hypothetical protein
MKAVHTFLRVCKRYWYDSIWVRIVYVRLEGGDMVLYDAMKISHVTSQQTELETVRKHRPLAQCGDLHTCCTYGHKTNANDPSPEPPSHRTKRVSNHDRVTIVVIYTSYREAGEKWRAGGPVHATIVIIIVLSHHGQRERCQVHLRGPTDDRRRRLSRIVGIDFRFAYITARGVCRAVFCLR